MNRRQRLWLFNGIGAVLLLILFMLMIMTAIAQQEVVNRIKADQLELGYSAALSIRDQVAGRQKELDRLGQEERIGNGKLQRAQSKFRVGERALEDSWQNLLPFLQRISRARVCEIALPADGDVNARNNALIDYRQCQSEPAGANSRYVQAGQNAADQFAAAFQTYRDDTNQLLTVNGDLDDTRGQLKERALTAQQEKISNTFSDMDVLLSGGGPVGRALVIFPPAMFQILLMCVSGLFGAVLITFILLVYPTKVVDVADTTATWARILLGGMIALCVYIVLLAGTAILGTNSQLTAAGSNYMAFSGIGILAGMFSDKVAGWLSEQAEAFFKRNRSKPSTDGAAKG